MSHRRAGLYGDDSRRAHRRLPIKEPTCRPPRKLADQTISVKVWLEVGDDMPSAPACSILQAIDRTGSIKRAAATSAGATGSSGGD
jgi:hypothetical protein